MKEAFLDKVVSRLLFGVLIMILVLLLLTVFQI